MEFLRSSFVPQHDDSLVIFQRSDSSYCYCWEKDAEYEASAPGIISTCINSDDLKYLEAEMAANTAGFAKSYDERLDQQAVMLGTSREKINALIKSM